LFEKNKKNQIHLKQKMDGQVSISFQ